MAVLDKVLDRNKVVKVEICTSKGKPLLSATKNFAFPNSISKENERFEPNDSLFLKGKDLPVFARNASVLVITHTRGGDRYSFPGHVAVSTEVQLNVTLSHVEAELLPDRRRYYKVSIEMPCNIVSIARGDKHVEPDPPLPSLIADINIGGVFLKHNELVILKEQDILTLLMPKISPDAQLTAKVLRVAVSPEGETMGYGCQFLFINPYQEETLGQFINRLQLEQRALERAEEETRKE